MANGAEAVQDYAAGEDTFSRAQHQRHGALRA